MLPPRNANDVFERVAQMSLCLLDKRIYYFAGLGLVTSVLYVTRFDPGFQAQLSR